MKNNKIEICKIKPNTLSKADLLAISDLIYDTDYDIYSDLFGNKETAREIRRGKRQMEPENRLGRGI